MWMGMYKSAKDFRAARRIANWVNFGEKTRKWRPKTASLVKKKKKKI
jgi:hypothetical protein